MNQLCLDPELVVVSYRNPLIHSTLSKNTCLGGSGDHPTNLVILYQRQTLGLYLGLGPLGFMKLIEDREFSLFNNKKNRIIVNYFLKKWRNF